MTQTDLAIHNLAEAFCTLTTPAECYLTYVKSLESLVRLVRAEQIADIEIDWEMCKESMK
jgi:hypothetical protein